MRDQKRPDLPAGMSPRERDFFAELRRLIDTAGLTVRGLEESTSLAKSSAAESFFYSKSQWSRWLNGHSRPPRKAVRRLAEKLTDMDIDAAHLVELWDLAFVPSRERTRTDSAVTRPRQLPPAAAYFTGRVNELGVLDGLAELSDDADATGRVLISVISGTAGVGKTALAVRWAHRGASRFPDGQLFIDLRGYDPSGGTTAPATALRGFLETLGLPTERIPDGVEAQTAMYRSLLADRRVLVVLDNARDAEQVRPLLPGSSGCMVIVTSRNQLTSLIAAEGARPLTLDLFSPREAHQLLARRIGTDRLASEPAAAAELLALCAGLPLAVCIVAALAAAHPGCPLGRIAAELRDAHGRLDVLDAGDLTSNVRAAFSCSYDNIAEAAARMFRLSGLHPGPDITAQAAASLAGIPLSEARSALADLRAAALMTEPLIGRYRSHDLLRVYAEEQARASESDAARHAAVRRALDHYLYTAHSAALLLSPGRDPLDLPAPQAGVAPEQLADGSEALAWFEAEHRVLLAVISLAVDTGSEIHAWQLTWAIGRFLDRRGHWADWYAMLNKALSAAELYDDLAGQAHLHDHLGIAGSRLGLYDDAHSHLRHALAMYQRSGDLKGMARANQFAGMVLECQGRYGEALRHSQQALTLFRTAGQRAGQADALNAIGWFHAHLLDYRQAISCCDQALDLYRELGDRHGEAAAWDSLGYAHHHLGRHTEAIAAYENALDLYCELGNRYYQADTLTHLGDAQHAAKDMRTASRTWQEALAILDELRHPDAAAVRARLEQPDA
jgi:tetratricopeptide (TPR) repeat protein